MPLYSYWCDYCDRLDTIFKPMSEYDTLQECPMCGQPMQRDIVADAPRVHGKRFYEAPLHSDSLAIAKSQVAEHKAKWPDIEIDSEFRPVFKSFKQHDGYLEDTGFA
ncbi:hypothetical protein LCGC14_2153720, partial [marine sediment metagenome]